MPINYLISFLFMLILLPVFCMLCRLVPIFRFQGDCILLIIDNNFLFFCFTFHNLLFNFANPRNISIFLKVTFFKFRYFVGNKAKGRISKRVFQTNFWRPSGWAWYRKLSDEVGLVKFFSSKLTQGQPWSSQIALKKEIKITT